MLWMPLARNRGEMWVVKYKNRKEIWYYFDESGTHAETTRVEKKALLEAGGEERRHRFWR